MVQLDGIRGLAVLGVLAWHWAQWPYLRYCPLGIIAVRVFFVLSGFLITGILLRARRQREEMGLPWHAPIKQFYIRRTLRIFPLYYLVVIGIIVAGVPAAQEHGLWHLLYLSNFRTALYGNSGGSTAHFWSLAVEEQFYLFFPWIVLFIRPRWFPRVLALMLLVGPLHRWVIMSVMGFDGYAPATILPLGCMDSLGAGALLAWGREESRFHPQLRNRLTTLCAWVGLPVLALGLLAYNFEFLGGHLGLTWTVLTDLGVALATAWLVSRASRGMRGPIGKLLEFRPLAYMGTISYCVYLIHPFVHNLSTALYPRLGFRQPPTFVHLSIDFAATVALATASWFLFERPLVRLGRTLTPDPAKASLKTRNEASQPSR
jgi:peptidoglycan/LPS O-acetylase OafA/YrhL